MIAPGFMRFKRTTAIDVLALVVTLLRRFGPLKATTSMCCIPEEWRIDHISPTDGFHQVRELPVRSVSQH